MLLILHWIIVCNWLITNAVTFFFIRKLSKAKVVLKVSRIMKKRKIEDFFVLKTSKIISELCLNFISFNKVCFSLNSCMFCSLHSRIFTLFVPTSTRVHCSNFASFGELFLILPLLMFIRGALTVTSETDNEGQAITSTSTEETMDVSASNSDCITKREEKPNSWTSEECQNAINKHFDSTIIVHNVFLCRERGCFSLSSVEQQRLQLKKFQHNWLNSKNWWLCFVEGEGMFCLACRKHEMKHPTNHSEVFAAVPSVRMKLDALITHSGCRLHNAALQGETLQRSSLFHREVTKQVECKNSVLEQAFGTAFFQMKAFIANRQFVPLLNHIEKVFNVESIKYFQHRSRGAQLEIFLTLGEAVKEDVLRKVKEASAYGILTDEVSDVSVTENLVTFIQYFNAETGQIETSFLACQNVLDSFESANAEAISSLIVEELEKHDGLDLKKFTGLTSDGASVMVGKRTGVAARLKEANPSLLNVHCVCHRLALACTDCIVSLKYINNLETILRQLWQFFENSPKKMAAYLKIQARLKVIHYEGKAVKRITKRLKKACRTRWLSFEASVKAVLEDYEAVLQTLAHFHDKDAVASGLLTKMKTLKFIGVIYILNEVLPILGDLSRRFQRGTLTFAAILPAVNMTKDRLQYLVEDDSPINKLKDDIESFTEMCSEVKMNQRDARELQSLFHNYIKAFIENIDNRFTESCPILEAFNIFDPILIPESGAELRCYGDRQIEVLANQYYQGNEEGAQQLKAEWKGFKYYIKDEIKRNLPESVKSSLNTAISPTEYCVLQILRNTGVRQLFPKLVFVAEIIASLPVSNAWPERGASTLKALKTRIRNRLGSAMLESLLHICINAPEPSSVEGQKLVKAAIKLWLGKKDRRKIPKVPKMFSGIERVVVQSVDTGMQMDVQGDNVSDDAIRAAVDIAMQKLNLSSAEYGSDPDSDWSDQEVDDCCP